MKKKQFSRLFHQPHQWLVVHKIGVFKDPFVLY